MNKTFLLSLFVIGAGSLVASSFIKQPNQKTKKVSIAHLKEQVATAYAEIVDLLLELSHEQTNCLQASVEEIKRMCNDEWQASAHGEFEQAVREVQELREQAQELLNNARVLRARLSAAPAVGTTAA